MKRIIIISIFILAGIAAAFSFSASSNKPTLPSNTPQQQTSATPDEESVTNPKKIIITKLNVNTTIEPVTVDSQGRMDIPSNFLNTAWYSLGAKPGEQGSAVIDGHVDTPQGTPSVFAKINTLSPGDTIQIITTNDKLYAFTVTKVESYPLEDIPLNSIFDQKTDEKRLNLITCSGTWDVTKKIYSSREVVYAKMAAD